MNKDIKIETTISELTGVLLDSVTDLAEDMKGDVGALSLMQVFMTGESIAMRFVLKLREKYGQDE